MRAALNSAFGGCATQFVNINNTAAWMSFRKWRSSFDSGRANFSRSTSANRQRRVICTDQCRRLYFLQ